MTAWYLMEWAKASGLPLLAVAVSGASVLAVSVFSWWQVRIAREKLRHDLYDRRFAIYIAFQELLAAILEKDDVEAELRKAGVARAHAAFLLDPPLDVYLEGLFKEALRITGTRKLVRDPQNWPDVEQAKVERAQKAMQLGQDRSNFFFDNGAKLAKNFERFLKLTDFSKRH